MFVYWLFVMCTGRPSLVAPAQLTINIYMMNYSYDGKQKDVQTIGKNRKERKGEGRVMWAGVPRTESCALLDVRAERLRVHEPRLRALEQQLDAVLEHHEHLEFRVPVALRVVRRAHRRTGRRVTRRKRRRAYARRGETSRPQEPL